MQFFLGNSKVQVRINPRLESLYVPMPINGLFPVISLNCIKHILVNPTINVNNVKRHETLFLKSIIFAQNLSLDVNLKGGNVGISTVCMLEF